MLTHEGTVGIAPAMTAIGVIAAVAGSLWWKAREEPPALPAVVAAPAVEKVAVPRPPVPPAPSKAVMAFFGFAEAQAPSGPPMDHASAGLQQLAAALAARGDSLLWRDRALRLEEAATRLEREPDGLGQAGIAREAFVQAAEWIAQLEGDAGAALDAARGIDAGIPLDDQAEEVTRFFHGAAESLRSTPAPRADENRA